MKGLKYLLVLLCLLFLSGCWDQNPLKEASLAMASSSDLTSDGKLLYAASFPRSTQGGKGGSQQQIVEIVSAIANTPREAQIKIDSKISGTFDSSKLRVLLIGEALAKQDINSFLDVLYRNPKTALGARPAVVEGMAIDLINLKLIGGEEISKYLINSMKSLQDLTIVNRENIESIFAKMLDPGQDFLIPYIKLDKSKSRASVKGLAMFHGNKYSGKHLTVDQSIMYLLMENEKGKMARFTKKVNSSTRPFMNNYITVDVKKMKRKLEVEVKKSGEINAHIHLNLKMDVIEYPHNRLASEEEIQKLNEMLSKELTNEAKTVIKKIQEANCDGLGIGRRIIAFYPDKWKKLNWEEDYPKIQIIPSVHVEIISHGITD
ncbi:Ger(x)C family spore germination protein [Neobacillus sp.]|uniref:Ger(x)C family spore germination protein n=1 Tax=Neobacillus sp. TaxID=2675273 RepID=UPI00289BFBFB|nr:Ger(x)C family spore germination protein [Neobacillus sp.]